MSEVDISSSAQPAYWSQSLINTFGAGPLRELGDSTIAGPNFRGRKKAPVSQILKYTQFWGTQNRHRRYVNLFQISSILFHFGTITLKFKFGPNFAIFDFPCKNYETCGRKCLCQKAEQPQALQVNVKTRENQGEWGRKSRQNLALRGGVQCNFKSWDQKQTSDLLMMGVSPPSHGIIQCWCQKKEKDASKPRPTDIRRAAFITHVNNTNKIAYLRSQNSRTRGG